MDNNQVIAAHFGNSDFAFLTGQEGGELVKAGLVEIHQPQETHPENKLAVRLNLTANGIALRNQLTGGQAVDPGTAQVAPAAAVQPAVQPAAAVEPAAPAAPVQPATQPAVQPAAQPVAQAQPVQPVAQAAPIQAAPATAQTAAQPAVAEAAQFAIGTAGNIPKIDRGNNLPTNRGSQYPYDQLAAPVPTGDPAVPFNYAYFDVPVTDKNKTPWKKMASSTTAANKRFLVPVVPEQVTTVTRKRMIRDAMGNAMLDANGKKQYEKYDVQEKLMTSERKFLCRRTKNEEGVEVARIFRVDQTLDK